MEDKPSMPLQLSEHSAEAISPKNNISEYDQNGQKEHGLHTLPWLQVLGSFCLNGTTWKFRCISDLLLSEDAARQGFSDSEISWIGSVQGFFMFLVSFLIGPVFDAGYLHSLLLVGTLLSVVGLFMISLCTTYWQLFLAQGVAMGLGFGCLYLPAPALVSMHFDRHRALAIGLSSSGSGIGAVVFPLVFTNLEPRVGFAWATRTIAFILLATSVIPLAIMRFPEARRPAHDSRSTSGRKRVIKLLAKWIPSLLDRAALHDTPFILLVIRSLTTLTGIYVMLYYINLLVAARTEVPQSLASQSPTFVNGASTVGRILPSFLADHIGPVHILAITAFLSSLLTFTSPSVHNSGALVVWAIAFGSFAGAFHGVARGGNRCGILVAEPVAGAILGTHGDGWVGLVGWSASLMMAGVCVHGYGQNDADW
ncbi:MFS general substrate transporter [Pleomassaria siparia CBS 279.74]|uniref:MFS general substrate transporter n=1 Tax=Pleomassaria siparia CBS 279.74 TaxID=1314801 RepID=A0A6G1JR35_9PLEO|nr:MFS general substrate transporter [Pleomassaria siparia CBS 279.74]